MFNLDTLIITVPAHVKVPVSTQPGAGKQAFSVETIFVDMKVPTEDELDAISWTVTRENDALNRRISNLMKARDEETGELGKRKIDADITAATAGLKSFQTEQLKAVIVGLPEGSGIVDGDQPAAWSPELVARLCQYRSVRTALWDAFTLVLNGKPIPNG